LKLIASRGGDDGSVHINQDVRVYASVLKDGERVDHDLAADRHAWIQLISGSVQVNGEKLEAGDGAAISEETLLTIQANADGSEFLLFDLK
jgi:redox-sensitive bicupin YhaK (pirin superfamily)